MGEALIVQKNINSNEEIFATIKVTYPSGSTCTCTNGDKILTDTNTNGTVIFAIPDAGTWTVKSIPSDSKFESTSQSVAVTEKGKQYSVTLKYRLYFYKDGAFVNGFTGKRHNYYQGWSSGSITAAEFNTFPYAGTTYFHEISGNIMSYVKGYATLKMDYTHKKNGCMFGIGTQERPSFHTDDNIIVMKKISSTGVHSLDISKVTASTGYISVRINTTGKGAGLINSIWVET